MPGTEHSSSPAPAGFNTLQEEIAYYKSQYEQLEVELQEFQASSRELEAELEKDVEASEKRERSLKEKVESLNYEVEEWKVSENLMQVIALVIEMLTSEARRNIGSQRQRPIMRKTPSRRKSPLLGIRAVPSS